MPRTIEIEEEEIRRWTCPKCGRHLACPTTKETDRCGDELQPGCGAEFPTSEYEANSVVTGTQYDLVGTAYKLLMEEAHLHGAECMALGALPGNCQVTVIGTVKEMAESPFHWARHGLPEDVK